MLDILLSPLLPIITIIASLILGAGFIRWKTSRKGRTTTRVDDAARVNAATQIVIAEDAAKTALDAVATQTELRKSGVEGQTDEEAIAALETRYKDKLQ